MQYPLDDAQFDSQRRYIGDRVTIPVPTDLYLQSAKNGADKIINALQSDLHEVQIDAFEFLALATHTLSCGDAQGNPTRAPISLAYANPTKKSPLIAAHKGLLIIAYSILFPEHWNNEMDRMALAEALGFKISDGADYPTQLKLCRRKFREYVFSDIEPHQQSCAELVLSNRIAELFLRNIDKVPEALHHIQISHELIQDIKRKARDQVNK